MMRLLHALAVTAVLVAVSSGAALAQDQSPYPLVDKLADKVIAHYQSTSCEQLAAEKAQPPSGQRAAEEQRVIQQLKDNPQMAQYFINKVAAPIAGKLFECGMIP